jgi:hypothetical protein
MLSHGPLLSARIPALEQRADSSNNRQRDPVDSTDSRDVTSPTISSFLLERGSTPNSSGFCRRNVAADERRPKDAEAFVCAGRYLSHHCARKAKLMARAVGFGSLTETMAQAQPSLVARR